MLLPLGFDREDLKTTNFSIDTEYESYQDHGTYKQRFVGYKYTHILKLEFEENTTLLGKALYNIAICGVNPEPFVFNLLSKMRQPERKIRFNAPCSIFSLLSLYLKRFEEAESFLSEALPLNIIGLVNSVSGYALVLSHRKDYDAARKMLSGFIDYLRQFKEGGKADFTDKIMASMVIAMAHVYILEGKMEEAKECLGKVLAFVRQFDAAPDYGIQTFRYPAFHQDAVFSDGLGASAAEGIETLLRLLGNQELSKMWKEMTNDE